MKLPYDARPGQLELAEAIRSTQDAGTHLVAEAPTGIGKTVAALAPALEVAAADGRRLLYVTRTNSQQDQVVAEHRALRMAGADVGPLIPLMGRRHYCPLFAKDPEAKGASMEELGRMCRSAKAAARRQHASGQAQKRACPHFLRLLEDGTKPVEALLDGASLTGAELRDRIAAAGSCPYEALKELLPTAQAIVLPYIYLIDDGLRGALLDWIGVGPDECHVVMDEAHHLPEQARAHYSPSLGVVTIQRAIKEAARVGDPLVLGRMTIRAVLEAIQASMHRLAAEFAQGRDDALLPPGALEQFLMQQLGVPSPHLVRAAKELETWGDVVRDEQAAKGKVPRSYLGAAGQFLTAWLALGDQEHIQIIEGGPTPKLEACLQDATHVLGWLHEFASTVHMSGTMAPLPAHVDACGLPATCRQTTIASPFEGGRLRMYGVRTLSRQWQHLQDDPAMTGRQQEFARNLLGRLDGKTGLFFTSHQMLADYLEEGFLHGVDRRIHVESPDLDAGGLYAMVARFKRDDDPNALLLAVLGGRITEGLDFPGDALSNVLVFGVPYPRPTARLQALVHYQDCKHGGGWDRVVHTPVARVLRQAIGRIIRGPEDRGVAVVLDERVQRFSGRFLPGLRMINEQEEVAGWGKNSGDWDDRCDDDSALVFKRASKHNYYESTRSGGFCGSGTAGN